MHNGRCGPSSGAGNSRTPLLPPILGPEGAKRGNRGEYQPTRPRLSHPVTLSVVCCKPPQYTPMQLPPKIVSSGPNWGDGPQEASKASLGNSECAKL